ncbi:Succinyl-diaminopimelate desuccinylase [Paraburkholderia caffeinitolerans]|uniref:Succinyl-diaminopimelate desuccinylase n=1 Tax=Paraburkholderia caffeinitolerans TaxID=1723730 RepID=A0A6J5G629_9BURK|nr:M20 family metallopeptidase [Paraburkholderia caffeinitolerans]CAB3792394.1 Succinyl-diaminopimelate desuccinylase [Paraburkholderia caffeinitolerans]
MTESRQSAIDRALHTYDSGAFLADLQRRVGFRTESQNPAQADAVRAYLTDEVAPALAPLGFTSRIVENPAAARAPMLIAERIEDPALPSVLTYGHGDVVRGYDEQWREGLAPWTITVEGDRWYGRGTADNKGQHSVNFAALAAVLDARGGKLGYNVKLIFETGEEIGSPGLDAVCAAHQDTLAADVFIASDGPRVLAERPTLFLGSRGGVTFELLVDLRKGAHHSGNWGGALRNPAIVLSHAIASLVDARGAIAVDGLRPPPIPQSVREALADIVLGGDEEAPAIDPDWGEPGLTPTERVIAWNTLEVLAFKSGNPDAPVNAIPPTAKATCQLRFVVGTDAERAGEHLEAHFARLGLNDVQVRVTQISAATRLDPDDAWVQWTLESLRASTGKKPALLPNLGGTVPNDVFAYTLGLPTLWIPHSYPACAQHAPNEHLLGSVAREALAVMAGLWWDLGDDAARLAAGIAETSPQAKTKSQAPQSSDALL